MIGRGRSILGVAAGAAVLVLVISSCTSSAVETTTTIPIETTPSATADAPTSTTHPVDESTVPPTTTTTQTTTTKVSTPTSTTPESTSTTVGTPTTTSTSTPPPADNRPPTVEIISPGNLSSHIAVYDAATQRFGAAVSLSAVVSDPNGDPVTVQWISSDEGYLGTGESIIAVLHTGNYDSAQPRITARAIDQWNTTTEATVQIIVWILSDA